MTTSSLRRWVPILVLAALSAAPVCGQIVPARNADAKNGFVFRVGRGRVGTVGVAQFDGVVIICQPVAQPVAADGDAPLEGEQPPGVQVTFSQGSLEQLIFGQSGGGATAARGRLAQLLDRRIKAVDRTCQLTDSQIEKLQLAGRGDLKRLLDHADRIQARFENVDGIGDVDQFQKWATDLSSEIDAVRPVLNRDPFDGDSLFAKTLKKTLNPRQAAEYKRTPAARLVAAGGPGRVASLEEILREWERAATRRGRLDCRFTRFRYDPDLKVEHRGRGSLAVDRLGRAAYEIGPATIEPGAVSQKKSKEGDPYELKADRPERRHWTGTSVIRVDETAHTFDVEALDEFHLARPFLLGMPSEELRERFDVKLINTTEAEIRLHFEPRQKNDQAWLRNAIVILSSADYLPTALRVVDAAGMETVHVFSNVSVMATRDGAGDALPRGREPLDRPNLNGYSRSGNRRP